jgi:transcription termination/antitermination protein NusA
MFITDIKRVIDQVSREKGIDPEVLINTLKEAIVSAARKKLGPRADIEVHYDGKTGEIEVFHFKEVVDAVEFSDNELTLEQGYEFDPECEIGDSLGIRIDTEEFGRIAAQSAKQVIIQKMREAERNAVYENFIHKKGKIINGIVQRFDRGSIIVNLGQAEAVLRPREQMPKENYKRGDRIRAYVLDVLEESKGAQIILSRTHPEFLMELFKTEVPEVAEGIVTLQGAARVPGVRAKIAVSSIDSDVDPVGACVGMKGNRVQSIVQELRGEKIDIVQWSPDVARYVCNALSPAEISRVIIDEDNRSMEVIVNDDYLSLAIGKGGRMSLWHVRSPDGIWKSLLRKNTAGRSSWDMTA